MAERLRKGGGEIRFSEELASVCARRGDRNPERGVSNCCGGLSNLNELNSPATVLVAVRW
jgi:hypothetical protein